VWVSLSSGEQFVFGSLSVKVQCGWHAVKRTPRRYEP
jgi:hypothetical protein